MLRSRSLVLLAVLVPGCMCGETLLPMPGAARGRICDADTGLGIGQVAVHVDADSNRIALTDSDGAWDMDDLPAGPALVTADANGVPRTFDVEIVSGRVATVTDPACRELPGPRGRGRIEGRICNRHVGEVIVDADVSVTVDADHVFTDTTDTEGRFAIENVPVGERILVVQAPGFQQSYAARVRENETTIIETDGCFNEVPTDDPPTDDPPTDDPPTDDPPTDDPPTDDPPTDDPPADDPADPCVPVEVDIFLLGDCLTASCPNDTPVPVGCNVLFSPGDDRGCVAHTVGDSAVYFQAGDQCNVGVVGGTLLCQATGCGAGAPVTLDANNCPINKPVDIYAADPSGCPEVH